MRSFLICLLASFILFSCKKSELFIYVSPSGNDQNTGNIDAPLKSLEQALLEAKKLRQKNNSPVTISLRKGTHYLKSTLQINGKNSGTEKAPLKIAAYQTEHVVLSGAKALSLKWEKAGDNLMKAKLDGNYSFSQLFIDGKKKIRARYPNFDPDENIFNGYSEDAIGNERVKGWSNPRGGILHAMHRAEWGGYHYLIEGKKENGELELTGGFQNNRQMGMHPRFKYVENIREELDSKGEWFLDEVENVLYYYPDDPTDLNTVLIEAPVLDHLIEVEGTKTNPAQYIELEGLTFTHTNSTYMKTDEPLLRSDWTIYRGGTVLFTNAENCTISKSHFINLGGNGVFVNKYNLNIRIESNHFEQVGASAVAFVGNPDAVRSPSFQYYEYTPLNKLDREPGPKTDDYPSQCVVNDNLIHNIGRIEKQVAGVQISMAMDITISHNSIYNVPRAGINISEGTWGGHIIEYNDVFDTVLETGDHGSFNSWGRDRFWHPNRDSLNHRTSTEPNLVTIDPIHTTIIRNNRFRCDHGWDIDLDDGSSNYHIYNNLCLNGGIKLREGFNRTVENNIMVNNSFHPHVWFDESHDIFRRNIVTTNYKPIIVPKWGDEVDYNLLPDSAALMESHNKGIDINSLYGNPEFINPELGDFRVKESSLALKLGFKNFPMDQFGVESATLKAIAQTSDIPLLFIADFLEGEDNAFDFLGASVRKVKGLGERSAAGLSEEKGVIVLKVPENSKAFESGLKVQDVILKINGDETPDIRKLMDAYRGHFWRGHIELTIIRNQKEKELSITLK